MKKLGRAEVKKQRLLSLPDFSLSTHHLNHVVLIMDQKELRLLENQCIQEEPPECMAACPIHLDARVFVGQMARGAFQEAWKVLRKTMPFPGILGRICDAPCRDHCKR
ncbi:MAG: hypothetical protein WCR46_21135, partial [Deltaproteobacteria bacterium]